MTSIQRSRQHSRLAGGPDGSGDIWYGDTLGTSNLLFDGTDERNPQTDGTRVIWEHFDGLDFELYIVDLASPNTAIPATTTLSTT